MMAVFGYDAVARQNAWLWKYTAQFGKQKIEIYFTPKGGCK